MNEPLRVDTDRQVQLWTIDVPQAGNAITGDDFIDAFERAVDGANDDPTVCAVILTGTGRIFSSGGNVHQMRDRTGLFGLPAITQRQGYLSGIQRIPRAMQRCEVPVIAAVNGAAIGAGCDLATMCDLRVAASDAFFAESFVQLGLIPGDGGSWFLPRAIGPARAAEMTLTGDRVDAQTALAWGLVNEVVAPSDLLPAARRLAERIAKNPVHAVRMAKRLLVESRTASLDSVLNLAAAMQPLAHQDPEHHRRLEQFTQRQKRATQ